MNMLVAFFLYLSVDSCGMLVAHYSVSVFVFRILAVLLWQKDAVHKFLLTLDRPVGRLEADVGFSFGGARSEFEEDIFAGGSYDGPCPGTFEVARLLREGGRAGVGPVMNLKVQNLTTRFNFPLQQISWKQIQESTGSGHMKSFSELDIRFQLRMYITCWKFSSEVWSGGNKVLRKWLTLHFLMDSAPGNKSLININYNYCWKKSIWTNTKKLINFLRDQWPLKSCSNSLQRVHRPMPNILATQNQWEADVKHWCNGLEHY